MLAALPTTKILIVDDHEDIRDPLATFLRRYGHEVDTAANASTGRQLLGQRSFDIVVLDVMLPGEDGFSLCRYVHERLRTPVILLSAMADHVDRIAGLEVGADDYVTKPFDPRELLARIKSVLRRTRAIPAEPAPPSSSRAHYIFNGWSLDLERQELRNPNGELVMLSAGEHRLLSVLIKNPNTVFSRDRLLDLTSRGLEPQAFDRSIDSLVSRLRRKLETDPRKPQMLRTAWGDGYRFAAEVCAPQ